MSLSVYRNLQKRVTVIVFRGTFTRSDYDDNALWYAQDWVYYKWREAIMQVLCGVWRETEEPLLSMMLRYPGGGLAQGLSIRLFAFDGAYWPLATAHSDPLWARTCFGRVNGASG